MAFLYSQLVPGRQTFLIDSLRAKLGLDSAHIYRFQRLRPYLNWAKRNSFINDAPVNVNGLELGALIKEKWVLGFGLYGITQKAKRAVRTKTDKKIDVDKTLDLRFATLFYQYVAIDKRYFEMDIQAEFGLGKYTLKLTDAKTG